jgi:EPS-associated MarR family transcriptional regulator
VSIEYQVLRELEQNPSHTQRTLAEALQVSLGKVNYVLAGLIGKGIVKARKLRNHPEQIRWRYVLTPKGIREKVRITGDYLARRMAEYDQLRQEIEALREEVAAQGLARAAESPAERVEAAEETQETVATVTH